jgi:hypothetical protein
MEHHPSRDDEDIEPVYDTMEGADRSQSDKLKLLVRTLVPFTDFLQALKRDNYRCRLSGMYDPIVKKNAMFKDILQNITGKATFVHTHACHVIPIRYNLFAPYSDAHDKRAHAWYVLNRFVGNIDIMSALHGCRINGVDNILTLEMNLHKYFDAFEFWLDDTVSPISHLILKSFQLFDLATI